ncbi:MAG: type IV secretion system VirB10 domain protein [Candidatus Xenolissoclinum pacificiensis L6]|uniref:Type IV secretion system VirB10 domain protein n=1 Tax=Candidatus Xenolissoclinum pacificiensis L6 TaxID=1401685 RepID=W2V115_9RICK|nr:MAG: type IV secretion system VirB10 domain protein [Candidatus Xenolissoclinum pacificiensis L6]
MANNTDQNDNEGLDQGRRSAVAIGKKKNAVLILGAFVVAIIFLYYYVSKSDEKSQGTDVLKVEKVVESTPVLDEVRETAKAEKGSAVAIPEDALSLAALPDVPDLKGVEFSEEELKKLEVQDVAPAVLAPPVLPALPPPPTQLNTVANNPPILAPPVASNSLPPRSNILPTPGNASNNNRRVSAETRSGPMIAFGGGGGSATSSSVSGEGNKDTPSSTNSTGGATTPTQETITEDTPINRDSGQIKVSFMGDFRYLIAQGKVIDAVLETAINTDLKGMLRAVVTKDVHSEDGQTVLIQKGSRLIGEYNTNISLIQSRVEIAWSRLMLVNGLSISLNAYGADSLGRAGIHGQVDNKFANILVNSLLLTTIQVGSGLLLNRLFDDTKIQTSTETDGSTTTVGNIAASLAVEGVEDLTDTLEELVERYEDSKPTILVHQGAKLKVFIAQDIVFPKRIYKNVGRV